MHRPCETQWGSDPSVSSPAWHGLLQQRCARLRQHEPDALAILIFGSYGRGDAGPYSDLDLRVITSAPPRVPDRWHFVPHPEAPGRLLHVSVGARTMDEILSQASDPARRE